VLIFIVLFDEKVKNSFFEIGHYYGTPRPTKGSIMATNRNLIRRSNSANEMFQNNENISSNLSGEFIKSSLKKSPNGFGFTIIGGYEKGERFLQIKDILSDGPAAKEGKLQRGDILVSINDANVLGYTHTDVVKIFQSLSIGDIIYLTVCRGYPLSVNFDDPQIDVVSLNGVHHLPNGGYREYQGEHTSRIYAIKVRKGDQGFGFTIADSLSGQRVKVIVDRQRCQNLYENDLLLSINGLDLAGKHHHEVVDILAKCPRDIETIFVIRRGTFLFTIILTLNKVW
jgi:endothelial cell adhesion protein